MSAAMKRQRNESLDMIRKRIGPLTPQLLKELTDKIPVLKHPSDGFHEEDVARFEGRVTRLSVVDNANAVRCPPDPLTAHLLLPENPWQTLLVGAPGYPVVADLWRFMGALGASRDGEKKWLVADAPEVDNAIQFYKTAFGAEEVSRKSDPTSVELKLESFGFFVSDCTCEDSSRVKPAATGVVIYTLETEDVEAVVAKSLDVGAVAEGEITDGIVVGGRVGKVMDPYGYRWMIYSPPKRSEMAKSWIKPSYSSSTFDFDLS